jgi:hypothetical protein
VSQANGDYNEPNSGYPYGQKRMNNATRAQGVTLRDIGRSLGISHVTVSLARIRLTGPILSLKTSIGFCWWLRLLSAIA